MGRPAVIQYWVTYPSGFKPAGTVHRTSCERFFKKGYGRLLAPEELSAEARDAADCKICGGRWE